MSVLKRINSTTISLLLGATAVLLPSTASAQTPGIEMYGGLAYLNAFSAGARHGYGGLEGSVAFNKTDWVGLMIEAGGQYRLSGGIILHAYDLMGGAQFIKRGAHLDESAHALFGVMHGLTRGSQEDFPGATLGGAFDVHGTGLLALRIQGDYLPNAGSRLYNDARVTIGGVLRLRR